jgi:putative ABC transport system ATP-binding protein
VATVPKISSVVPASNGVILFDDVTKVFDEDSTAVHAVRSLSFAIPQGQFWAIMGPSGSGKSTVLHLIAGLTPPTSGRVVVDGLDLATASSDDSARLRRTRVGYVLQAFNLLPFLSAERNVAMPLVLEGVAGPHLEERIARALKLVNMSHRASHRPSQLSGGEQQRIAIARAIAIEPAIILADEPTGNLDRANGVAVMELIREINVTTGVTILMVTHDPLFAAYAHRVLRLVDGSIEQSIDVAQAEERADEDWR